MQFFKEMQSFTTQEKNAFTNPQKKHIRSFYAICNILYKKYSHTIASKQPTGKYPKPISDTLLKTVLRNAPRLVFGKDHGIFLQNGDVVACGDNERGQLGLGDKKNRSDFERLNLDVLTSEKLSFEDHCIIGVGCGEAFTVLLNTSGTLFVFGANFYKQLGIKNHYTEFLKPIKVTLEFNGVNACIERGKKVSCGYEHTVVLTQTNNVVVFGSNEYNQLGFDNENQEKYYLPRTLDHVATLNPIMDIACGLFHTAILSQSGDVFLFGQNYFGQLGNGNEGNCYVTPSKLHLMGKHEKIIAVSCGAKHTVVLTQSGKVFGFGSNEDGQLGLEGETNYSTPVAIPIPHEKKATAISCGAFHTMALTEYGLYATGFNKQGQLGVGDTNNRSTMTLVNTHAKRINAIGAGFFNSYFMTTDEEIFLCGNNEFNQLGLGNEMPQNQFVMLEKKPTSLVNTCF